MECNGLVETKQPNLGCKYELNILTYTMVCAATKQFCIMVCEPEQYICVCKNK